jgi:hypothetical protein
MGIKSKANMHPKKTTVLMRIFKVFIIISCIVIGYILLYLGWGAAFQVAELNSLGALLGLLTFGATSIWVLIKVRRMMKE